MKGISIKATETPDGLAVSFTFSYSASKLPSSKERRAELCAFFERCLEMVQKGQYHEIGHSANGQTIVRRDDWLIEGSNKSSQ